MRSRFRRLPTAVAALVVAVSAAAAQTGYPEAPVLQGKLSLMDAVKLALLNNRALQQAVEERIVAKGRLIEARGDAIPHVDLDGQYYRVEKEIAFTFPDPANPGQEQKITLGYLNNYRADLAVTQKLYEGGRTFAALKASKLYRAYADEQVRLAMQFTIYDTVRTYYRALLSQEQVRVSENAATLAETLLADVEIKKKYGVASDFNVLRSKVEVSNAKSQVIVYQNALKTDRSELFKILGASQDSDVELTEKLEFTPVTPDEQEALREAVQQRPDVLSQDLVVQLQTQNVKATKSPYFPKLSAFYTYTLARPDPVISTLDAWGRTWRVGLSLNWSIFDGGTTYGKVMQEQAHLRQQEIAGREIREQTKLDIRKAVLGLRDAAEAVEVQRQTLQEAEEGLRLADVGYREGTLQQVTVLESRGALTNSQLFYFQALYRHAMARLEFQRAKGTLGQALPEPSSIPARDATQER